MKEVGITDINKNPFAVHSPDALNTIPADYIVNLFVEEYTRLSAIEQQKHTFLWGSRGSGKSFILRYMEPECQEIRHDGMGNFLAGDDSFFGVYIPCKKGLLDKTEFGRIEEKHKRQTISEHFFNIIVSERIISTIDEQLDESHYDSDGVKTLIEQVLLNLDSEWIGNSKHRASTKADRSSEPIHWLKYLLEHERNQVLQYLKDLSLGKNECEYEGPATGYHDFILPFMQDTQAILNYDDVPIYLLIDDAFYLREHQQKIVNTWLANRDQGCLCVKVSSDRARYDTFETKDGDTIDKTHDYTEVRLDEQYTTEHSDYRNKIKQIANRRLEISPCPTDDIENFLPEREFEKELLEEIKEDMREEWEEEQGPGDNVNNFIDKYAQARLHQRISENKNSKSYAGFEYLVHISAGRIRDFLEPCQLMFEKRVERGSSRDEIDEIPHSTQDEIIQDFSRELLQERPQKIRKDLDADQLSTLDKLTTLVRSLGDLFHERLHDKEHREPRVFSFSVRDVIPQDSEVGDVLELGTQRGYFSLDTYPSKEGGGGEDLYILNRRLAPVFTIDPTSFRGRVQLDHNKLKVGCEDPDEFVRLAHGTDKSQEQLGEFSETDGNGDVE